MVELSYKPRITVMDVLESKACFKGICEWIEANKGIIAGPTKRYRATPKIAKAANCDGYGYGYGYGDGDGDGDGYGYGDGYGDGSRS